MERPRGRFTPRALAALLIAGAASLAGGPAAAQGVAAEARVIVKLRAGSALEARMAAQSAGRDNAADGGEAVRAERARALGQRHGLSLRAGAAVSERTQVVHASGIDPAALAARLAQDADVEYAVVDRRRFRNAVPNDPLYPNGLAAPVTPTTGQWTLRAPTASVRSAINAAAAWDVTPGNPAVVVAVLDSGVRFDHEDLRPVSQGGNLLPGYDMISEVATSGDGNGRDPDPSDAGDYLTADEIAANPSTFDGCEVQGYSSWHGLQVAGIVGATTDNGIGMAGVGRTVRVLPVRVLGKCGGFDSDIVPAIRWAAGLHVPGVPDNPRANWARVINLSLGSAEDCTAVYRDAIAEVNALGVVVVASAGNSTGHWVGSPANCPGVIAVAGLRHAGSKVGFSDLGPDVAVAAPAGNCINTGTNDPCLYPILTLTNRGITAPLSHSAGGSAYTDSYDFSVGTSFAAPLVAGTAALMLSVQPALAPLDVKQIIQTTARAFPQDPTVARCTAPQYDAELNPVDQLECYCSNGVCGAGMLDAGAAVLATFTGTPLPRSRARIDVTSPTAPGAGTPVVLSGARSEPANGTTIVSRVWSLVDSGGIVGAISSPTADPISLLPRAAGRFTVRLTVTDSRSSSSSSSTDLTVVVLAQAPSPPPENGGGGGGGAFEPGWLAALAVAAAFSSPRRSGARRRRARRT